MKSYVNHIVMKTRLLSKEYVVYAFITIMATTNKYIQVYNKVWPPW